MLADDAGGGGGGKPAEATLEEEGASEEDEPVNHSVKQLGRSQVASRAPSTIVMSTTYLAEGREGVALEQRGKILF